MRVRVILMGGLKREMGRGVVELELEPGTRAEEVIDNLAKSYPEVASLLEVSALARGEELLAPGEELSEGDEIVVLPPVGGG